MREREVVYEGAKYYIREVMNRKQYQTFVVEVAYRTGYTNLRPELTKFILKPGESEFVAAKKDVWSPYYHVQDLYKKFKIEFYVARKVVVPVGPILVTPDICWEDNEKKMCWPELRDEPRFCAMTCPATTY